MVLVYTHTRTSAHTRRPPMVLVYTHTRTSAHTRRPPTYPHMSAHIHAQHDYTDWSYEPSGKRSVSWPVPVIEAASRAADAMDQFVPRNLHANRESKYERLLRIGVHATHSIQSPCSIPGFRLGFIWCALQQPTPALPWSNRLAPRTRRHSKRVRRRAT